MLALTLSRLRLRACACAALVFALAQPGAAQKPFNLAAGPDTLFVSVNNIAIAGEYALRGKTANFHYPVLSMLSVVDSSSSIVTGLADTVRWLDANERAENGLPITQIWPRLFEYHRDNPLFPPNPDLYQSSPGVSFTEVREWQNFPTSTMLVMDVSGSMQDQIDEARDANLLYVNLLRAVDRAGVIQFDDMIRRNLGITNNFAQVRDSINAALPLGNTAIYEALALAIQETKSEIGRRRVIILYTDGNNNVFRDATVQSVIDSAQVYGIPIFTIALGGLTNDVELARIAQETGGLFFKSPTEKELAGIYRRLSDIVQNFYVMAHGSPDPIRNNTWRTVDVTASLPNRNGRGKGYYFVGAQPTQTATDVALTFASITDTQVVVNNRSVNAVQPGAAYLYRVRLHNRGPAAASNLRVRQFLPDSVRLLDASRPPLFTDGDSLLWQLSSLAAGAEDSILVEARLAANVPNTLQELFSSARLFVANDTTPLNNAAFDTVRVIHPTTPPPNNNTDLALAMNAITDTSIVVNGKLVAATKPGDEYEYRLKLRNLGPKAASNIRVRQLLPDSVSFVRASLAPSFVDKDSLAWQVASLQVGKEDSINVTVKLAANVPRTLALLSSEAKLFFANDTTPANNAAFDTVRVIHPTTPPPNNNTDLALAMNAITDTSIVVNGKLVRATKPGDEYEYRLKLRNLGPKAASNIRVRQLLPDSVSFVRASLAPSFVDKDSLTWQVASLQVGEEDSINVTVKLAANVPRTLALLSSEAKLFFANDTTPSNNAAFDTVRVIHPTTPPPNNNTDLALAMNAITDTSIVVNGKLVRATKPGDEYEYRLKLRNLGPKAASNIRVRQLLPDSVSFVRASLAPSFVDKDSLAWQLASLSVGNEDSINVTVRLAANVPRTLALLSSEAKLFFANDTTPSNNAAFDTVHVIHPTTPPPNNNTDLALAMNAITDTSIVVNGKLVRATKPGDEYEYRLKLRNLGPKAASNIRVRQLLPDSVSFVRASLAPSFVDKDSLAWQLASLSVGNEDSINVTVKLAANVPRTLALLSSEAKLFFANDTTPSNNAAFDTVRVIHPTTPPPNNNTDLALAMNAITDTSIVVNGKLVAATKPGDEYEYRLKLRNLGPKAASNIRLRQLLPDSVSFVRASLAPAFVDKDSLAWQLASLSVGNEDSINVTVRLAANVPRTLALLSSEAKLFFANDTTPANNAAFDTVRVIHPTTPPPNNNTDLALAMNAITDTSIVVNGKLVAATKPGDEYEYRLKLRNLGPKAASNIRLRQLLPDSVSFVRASLAPAFVDKDSLAWQLASLSVGNEDSINVTVRLAANVPRTLALLSSEAKLFFANDTTPANNAAFDTVRVIHPTTPPPNNNTDLALALNAITDTSIVVNGKFVRATKPGDEYEYRLKLRNLGPKAASNIRVRQLLPDSVSFVRASLPPSFVDQDSLAWQVASLNAGNEDSINVTVRLAANVPRTLELLSSEAKLFFANDTTPSNNAAFDTVRVIHPAPPPLLTNLAITQRAETDSFAVVGNDTLRFARAGETYRYRLVLANESTVAAQNVVVTNFLPDSIRVSNISPSAAIVTSDSLQWRFTSLAQLSKIILSFDATVAAQMPLGTNLLINQTKSSAANEDPTQLANNVSSSTVYNVVAPPPIPKAVLRVWQTAQTDSFALSGNDTLRFARVGETYRYTLTVSNESDNEALNVRLLDFLPDSITASALQPQPSFANNDSVRWALGNLAARTRRTFTFNAKVSALMPVGTNLLINKITARADNLDLALSRVSASDTVRNIVRPQPPLLIPLIEARPPVVNVGEKIFVRVQVLDAISAWDLWVYFADGGIDSSFADAFIAANPQLAPNVWHEVEPSFNNTRLVTQAKQEDLRFEIRTRDRLQRFASARATVLVQSGNDMALDRNVYEPDRESGLNINFKLSSNRKARLEVYDLAGHYVTKLAEGEYNAGWNTHVWNGVIAENGCVVGSGVYLVLLRAGEYENWKKVIIVR